MKSKGCTPLVVGGSAMGTPPAIIPCLSIFLLLEGSRYQYLRQFGFLAIFAKKAILKIKQNQ